MDELSEEARGFIARAMDEDQPPPGAEDGSWGTVVARLTGERSIASDDAPAAAPLHEPVENGAPRNWWPAIGVGIAIIVASSIAIALRPSTSPTPAAPRPAIDATPPQITATPPRPSTAGTAPVRADDDDALLERAESALAADQGAEALALLERHAVVAALVEPERRMALRVLALCELGRVDDARVEARTFLTAHAASEHASRVRASCARP
jgi:hypothetical protein